MKRIEYKKISIKNFLSIGKTPVEIEFKKGIHIITGINRDKPNRKNGTGKSTIVDAFYFAHFGDTTRGIKKDLIVNDIVGKNTEVILWFDVIEHNNITKYKIIRTLKPSSLEIYCNNVNVTQSTMALTTKKLLDILGMSESLMMNCIIMTLNDTIPFMAKSKIDKRKFIESIFELDVLGRMLNEHKKIYRENKKDVEISKIAVDEKKRTIKLLISKQKQLENEQDKTIQRCKVRLNSLTEERKELKTKISTYTALKVDELQTNIDKIEKAIAILDKKQSNLTSKNVRIEASKYEQNIHIERFTKLLEENKCFECERVITQDETLKFKENIKNIQAKIKESDESIKINKDLIKDCLKKREKLEKHLKDFKNKYKNAIQEQEQRKTDTKRLESINNWIKDVVDDIKLAEDSIETFVNSIMEEVASYKLSLIQYRQLLSQKNVLEFARFALSDEGIKSKLVKQLVDILNDKIQYYLKALDGNCMCRFNEYFEEEILNNKQKLKSYFNFSGAEKKTIDLSCLFSFSDIKKLQGNTSYNVSIYDELFDSALDEKSVDLVIDTLNERVERNNECVLIISHRKEAMKAATGDIIVLEKHRDITTRIK